MTMEYEVMGLKTLKTQVNISLVKADVSIIVDLNDIVEVLPGPYEILNV